MFLLHFIDSKMGAFIIGFHKHIIVIQIFKCNFLLKKLQNHYF